jgi:hypothetical protein
MKKVKVKIPEKEWCLIASVSQPRPGLSHLVAPTSCFRQRCISWNAEWGHRVKVEVLLKWQNAAHSLL